MAAKTRAEMIERVLRRLSVLALGQTASSEDSTLVGEVLDSVHDQLLKQGLVNFASSSFPDWSQEPFTKVMMEEVGPYFGKQMTGMRKIGERELTVQMKGKNHARPIQTLDY